MHVIADQDFAVSGFLLRACCYPFHLWVVWWFNLSPHHKDLSKWMWRSVNHSLQSLTPSSCHTSHRWRLANQPNPLWSVVWVEPCEVWPFPYLCLTSTQNGPGAQSLKISILHNIKDIFIIECVKLNLSVNILTFLNFVWDTGVLQLMKCINIKENRWSVLDINQSFLP